MKNIIFWNIFHHIVLIGRTFYRVEHLMFCFRAYNKEIPSYKSSKGNVGKNRGDNLVEVFKQINPCGSFPRACGDRPRKCQSRWVPPVFVSRF